ncbi:transglycosylase domain-containing protein [uncultured Erythrobacter sp.]|uniref:transglycosylase domain-containing protein n=1 Tax=uncultured Erythrobacter sp. TaxID=263913 RepID=UPI00262F21C1|nr:transglycosylase domain-containing protein [uncultured Erythrobacter sp.]
MGLLDRFWKRRGAGGAQSGESGFYALYESQRPLDHDDEPLRFRTAGSPDYDSWDSRLGTLDHSVEREERRRLPFWRLGFWQGRRKRWWAVRIVAAMLALFLILFAWLAITAPLSKSLEPIAPPQVTLLASDGTPIARRGAMVGEPVEIENLPPHVVQAFLAIEDRRFYSHWGVDPRGIARAVWTGTGGGSTITQQLAKFTFLTPEQTLTRKAREALIAFWLEGWLTKDEILERYLSNAYFGDNQYGLRAASLHYFYRQPENLLPQQAAMLAGLLQAPSRYAPTEHYDRAKARMDLVVGAMVDVGYLTQAEADALPDPVLDVRTSNDLPTGTYFADWALPIAREGLETGYASQVLTTTLDSQLQALASRVTSRAALGDAQVALVAMRPSGEVVAMVGGRNYAESPFNRATQARRQPGSTFKLFVYLAALEAGWDPEDTIDNTAIEAGSYRPKNSRERYSESITLEDAFASSSNVAAVRLFNEIGSERVIRTARSLGVTSDLPEGDPSLALGTSTMTLLELTSAYAGVAANQYPVRPYAFAQEEQGWWEWLTSPVDSASARTHEDIERMLRAAINRGTGRAAELPIANYGKTGTTQNFRDALFVGYAGDLVVGVWVGNDDNSPLNGVSGGGLPARIWKDFMRSALSLPPPRPRASPDPEGPVQPFDIEEGEEIPLGEDGTSLRFEEDGIVLSQDGVPVEFRLDEDGLRVEPVEPD